MLASADEKEKGEEEMLKQIESLEKEHLMKLSLKSDKFTERDAAQQWRNLTEVTWKNGNLRDHELFKEALGRAERRVEAKETAARQRAEARAALEAACTAAGVAEGRAGKGDLAAELEEPLRAAVAEAQRVNLEGCEVLAAAEARLAAIDRRRKKERIERKEREFRELQARRAAEERERAEAE
eukprot:CAMPEP_0183791808 /NCGR_PEP_ID=MMETSP0803_2-20130417/2130_1 /TAXON_ID=195967 /ORGANISM="Crustomastix stigmata, Strain CCMP3273" /LENGTH=182 /DNA_ID=CAMNT_0026036141 /DNA_START=12 /DNA_END=557 /DNA_ORIENTATION=+